VARQTNYVRWLEQIPAAYWVIGAVLVFMPAVANDFWLFQVWGWAFILGMIALSLMFLAAMAAWSAWRR
jgi:branched-chain amino acid transport system permease protein